MIFIPVGKPVGLNVHELPVFEQTYFADKVSVDKKVQ